MYIQYSPFFKYPRRVFKLMLSSLYPLIIKIYPLPKVKSIPETIDKIIQDKCSICRFGDSEFLFLVEGRDLRYQSQDERLKNYFKKILVSNVDNILIGLPIGYQSLENLNKESKLLWRSVITWTYPGLYKFLDHNKVYYNASMTRLYIDYEDKAHCDSWFKKVRSIWTDRKVLLIEGEKSRLGVGNDLFSNAFSVKRVLGPARNAFDQFDNLLKFASQQEKDNLVLVAMGPTAKPLCYELSLLGYQSIDIGNLDVEYEWFLRGAKDKIKIPGKFTHEAIGGSIVEDVSDKVYLSQIIAHFKNE